MGSETDEKDLICVKDGSEEAPDFEDSLKDLISVWTGHSIDVRHNKEKGSI